MNKITVLILIIFVSGNFSQLSAADVFLSPDDADKSINRVKAGDTIWLGGGTYSKPVEFSDLRGSKEKPITITPIPGERVTFDGTDVLPNKWKEVTPDSKEGKLIQSAQWKRMQGKVYAQKLDE